MAHAAEPADLIVEHHVQTWTLMGSAAGGRLVRTPDFQLTLAALDHIPYNHVQRCVPTGDPDDAIDEALATLDGREAAWSVTGPASLAVRLEARGFGLYSSLTGMALDLTVASLPERPPPGTAEEVDDRTLETWADLVLDQWHLPPADRATLLAMHREFGFERVRRWLCRLDGAPVAKTSVAIHEPGVAGIYGVGTRPEARGKGIASALMAHVLHALRDAGVRTVVLQSTPVAVDIYRTLGFVEHCRFPVYTVPGASPPKERLART